MVFVQDVCYNSNGTRDFRLESDNVEELNKIHDRLVKFNIFTHVEKYKDGDDKNTEFACMDITHAAMCEILTNFAYPEVEC